MFEAAQEGMTPAEAVERAVLADQAMGFIAKLPRNERLIIIFFLHGKSDEETAEYFQITRSAVCQRRIRIYKKLRMMISADPIDEDDPVERHLKIVSNRKINYEN